MLLTTALAAVLSPMPQDAPWFTEVASSAGLNWSHVSDASDLHRFPEIMGGGLGLLDYDGDGLLDIYLVQSGVLDMAVGESGASPGNKLFKNLGDGTFEDVTEAAGVGHTGYGMGVACGDYDGDGDTDMYVTNVGNNVLYKNNGDGTFKDATEKAKVNDPRWGTSAAWFDADNDGDLDLYVVNNLVWSETTETPCFNYYGEPDYCSPTNYNAPSPDMLYTQGRLGFQEASTLSGVNMAFGNGLGIAIGDYDGDGKQDIYVANDASPNVLWHNLGKAKFEDTALAKGCAVNANGTPEAGMGVQFVDVDMDGDLDLFMTHLRRETNTFYMNSRGRFRDKTVMTGTAAASLKMTGFGMGFHDFDHDGILDLFVVNGAVQAWKAGESFSATDPYAEPNHLFRGLGSTKFKEVPHGGLKQGLIGTSRGAAFGDLDNDGDVDVVYVDRDAPVRMLRNDAPKAGGWIGFNVSAKRRKTSIGARIGVRVGETWRYRRVDCAYSYLSSNDVRVQVGLGNDAEGNPITKVDEVSVRWPGGKDESFGPKDAGAYVELKQGKGPK